MPAGITSRSSTFVAAALPELVYDSVTVTGLAPGDVPLVEESDFVTPITELATVVVSVFVLVVGLVSEIETVMSAVLPLAAAAGTVPATTKRKMPPEAIGPVLVRAVALSGM